MKILSYLRLITLPFSGLYGLIIFVRNQLFQRGIFKIYQPRVPVISVGNISVGGTGKTPLAEYIIHFFQDLGYDSAYLSRGYGRDTRGFQWVDPQKGGAIQFGDEALQVAMKFPQIPVAVCENRAEGIEKITQERNVSVVILDDAFQHRKVHRDLDIIVIDANCLPDRDFLLPAGTLREPAKSLNRSDLIVINKLKDRDQIETIEHVMEKWSKPLAFSSPKFIDIKSFWERQDKKSIMYQHLILFSGLGNNTYFLNQARQKGWNVVSHRAFRDHHRYTQSEIEELVSLYQGYQKVYGQSLCLLTTEKDYARLRQLEWMKTYQDIPFCFIPIGLEWWSGRKQVDDLLRQIIDK